jgi:hypothetical protein
MSYYINQRPSSQAMLAYEGEPSFCNAIQESGLFLLQLATETLL